MNKPEILMINRPVVMALALFIIYLPTVLASASSVTSSWNQEARDLVLDLHNEERASVGACQMNTLEYDMALEEKAKEVGEGCSYKVIATDQNVASDPTRHDEETKIRDAVNKWTKQSFDKKALTAGLNKVGCYSATCPDLKTPNSGKQRPKIPSKLGQQIPKIEKLAKGVPKFRSWWIICYYGPEEAATTGEPFTTSCDSE